MSVRHLTHPGSRRATASLTAVAAGAALLLAACGSSGSSPSSGSTSTAAASALCGGKTGSGNVVIGAASFGENETLAAIYADALDKCGYHASVKTFQSREVYYPALRKGQIQVVPEYAATLTDYINSVANGANAPSKASGDIDKTMAALRAELPSSLAALNPAAATDKNAFAITQQLSQSQNITTLSQLAAYSKNHALTLGGPPECPTRPFCEPGLKQTYGMNISSFESLDTGGPLTVKAIKSGTVDVGLVFTSDPTIAANGLVVLTDDKQLQASDNVVPLVSSSLANGAAATALNAVDSKLDQSTLVALNKAVEVDRAKPEQVATEFLKQEGLS